MKIRQILFILAVLLIAVPANAQNNPVANPDAQVIAGNARFTVLTDRLIRMEWSEDGKFEDNATLGIINRNLPVPAFNVQQAGDGVVVKTKKVTLKYDGDGKFTEDNLKVSFRMNGRTVTWKPGMDESGNLMGTIRTLDGCEGFHKLTKRGDEMDKGIISRDGWAVVDESSRHLLVADESTWGNWVAPRPEGDVQDLYIFAYGHEYTDALADFTKVAGRIPMPPKYVFGYWWSRYWAYSDEEFLALGQEFRDRKLPIDVMVIDMDWHDIYPLSAKKYKRDEFDQKIGWTGYTWNRDLFPDPEGFLNEVHGMGLKTSLNLHPASGILPREFCYEDFVADYLSRTDDYDGPEGYVYGEGDLKADGKPAKKGYHAPVPYRMSQKEWADAYFNSVIDPLENQGVDFWWLDWQQWRESKYMEGLSSTFWINHVFFNDKVRKNVGKDLSEASRPFIYHRWGGLGSHRYQLGFSGDTYIEWDVLKFLPWFTATASNVGYGYWGHDIGGHYQKKGKTHLPTDPEMYTRWLQYGVFTPIFKTHCTTSELLERRFWAFEDHYEIMKEALELRYALTPYIYDAARQTYDTGVSMTRPLYYYYPEVENAYTWNEEFMFGDNILATVLCRPMDPATGLTERTMWFPEGNDWYDMAHRKMIKGGTTQTLYYAIDENAWFVKAGCIIPLAEEGIQNLQDPTCAWRIYIAPGAGRSEYTRYEDDGESQAYDTAYATTRIEKNATSSKCRVKIEARKGEYRNMPEDRQISVVFGGLVRRPVGASANGYAIECSYDEERGEAVVKLPLLHASDAATVEIQY